MRASVSWALIVLAVAAGYAVSLLTELWVGALVTSALLPVVVRVLISWDRTRLVRRFPELDSPDTKWPRVRDWARGKEPTIEARQQRLC
jgi:hypothetical protein